ncbi:MAG: TonB-dependent siderophore receptor, partial [Leadbetterella sp.]
GIINFVTKKPKFDFGGEINMRIGSFGMLKPSLDIYGGLGKKSKIAYRLNGSYEKANSFRDGVSSERYFVNPSLLFKPSSKTEILLEADYTNDKRTPDFGAGIINYEIVDIPRNRFLGVEWSTFESNQSSISSTISHQFSKSWKLIGTGAFREYNTLLFSNTRPNSGSLISKEGMWVRNIQRSEVDNTYFIGQLDLNGTFATGKICHQLLVGSDYENSNTNTLNYIQLTKYDTLNIFNPSTSKIRTDIPTLTKNTLTKAPIDRYGIYAQDLFNVGKYIKILAGIRYTSQKTESNVLTYSTNKNAITSNSDNAFTPRLGLVVQPSPRHSIFASYANSFILNTGVDINGNALPPSMVDQLELGIKNQLLNNKASLNVTLYQINNDNLAQISLDNGNTNTNIKELAGAVRSEGIEIDFSSRPIPNLTAIAGYSYNITKYTKSNTFVVGSQLRYNPNHTTNLSLTYSFNDRKLKGLNMGLVGAYIGKRYAGRSTRIQVENDAYKLIALPSYTQVDAMFGYQIKNISIKGKVANLFDVVSYNVHDDNSVNPINPRNYALTLGFKF